MAKYRKKPIVIDAVRWDGDPDTMLEILPPDEKGNKHWPDEFSFFDMSGGGPMTITTSAGTMFCDEGDWIIKDVNGEFLPMTDEKFQATYEREDRISTERDEAAERAERDAASAKADREWDEP
jgi:hypothetical protein